jgi:phage terminase large subunit-like protein
MKQKSDFTVFTMIGRTKESNYDILYTKRKRTAGNVVKIQLLLDMCYNAGLLEVEEDKRDDDTYPFDAIYKPTTTMYINWYIENFASQGSIKMDFDNLVRRNMGLTMIRANLFRPLGDKRERLTAITGGLQTKNIQFNQFEYDSSSPTIKELLNFGSTYDDCVDALTLGILGMGYRPPLS